MTEASITCHRCGRTSHSPYDISWGYCAACHDWTGANTLLSILDQIGADGSFAQIGADAVEPPGMYYDRQGRPISWARWMWLYEGSHHDDHPAHGYAEIGDEEPCDGVRVLTIWDGIAPGGLSNAGIFETGVFIDGREAAVERYTSEEEARANHATLVRSLQMVGRSFLEDELAAHRGVVFDEAVTDGAPLTSITVDGVELESGNIVFTRGGVWEIRLA